MLTWAWYIVCWKEYSVYLSPSILFTLILVCLLSASEPFLDVCGNALIWLCRGEFAALGSCEVFIKLRLVFEEGLASWTLEDHVVSVQMAPDRAVSALCLWGGGAILWMETDLTRDTPARGVRAHDLQLPTLYFLESCLR